MVQEQLVDYISSQMKLDVSRDAIKSALVSAGWVAGDVEDTLKKIDTATPAAQQTPTVKAFTASPAVAGTAGISGQSMASKPAAMGGSAKIADPGTIRVSDLVSPKEQPAVKFDPGKFGGTIKGNTFQADPPASVAGAIGGGTVSGGGKGRLIGEIVGGIIIVALAGLAWSYASQNGGLAAQITSLNAQSANVSSQLSSLRTELDASSTSYAAQVASLTATNANLALELSFYAVPPGGATTTPISIQGTVSAGRQYVLATPDNAKIYVANSYDPKIAPDLKAAVGKTVTLSGTYVPGSDVMTVASVSGLPAATPTAPATSTAPSAAANSTKPVSTSTAQGALPGSK